MRSGTHGSSPTSSGTPSNNDSPQGNTKKSHTAAVAAGIVAGVLGLVAGGAAAYYLSKRRPATGSFHRLGPSDGTDDEDGSHGPIIPVAGHAGSREKVPAMQNVKQKLVGLVPGRAARQQASRRDMLADEDTRVFESSWYDVRREGSIGSWSSGGRRARPSLGGVVHDSLTSLRNVGGAVLAYASLSRRNRDATDDSNATYWEKEPSYGFSDKGYSDKIAFIPSLQHAASRQKGSRDESHASQWTYEDPFADYDAGDFKMTGDEYDDDAVEIRGAPVISDPPPKPYMYSRVEPPAVDASRLTPLSEKPSSNATTDTPSTGSVSVSSHDDPFTPPTSADNSRSSHEYSSLRRPSSIIDANPSISSAMRRSDSWWSRFTKTPLLDRTFLADTSRARSQQPLDFRDPNPPPRLVPIKETSNSLSPEDLPSKRGSRDDPLYASVHHGRSATSLQTSRTADSAEIDKMGRTMDIVLQGPRSLHGSRNSRSSTYASSSYEHADNAQLLSPLSLVIPDDAGESEGPPGLGYVMSPTAMTSADVQRPPPARRTTVGNVAARVAAFEEHSRPPPTSPGRSKKTQSVYGLAPKPSLFVANPDRRTGSGSS